jgi:hypothetical protein
MPSLLNRVSGGEGRRVVWQWQQMRLRNVKAERYLPTRRSGDGKK